MVDMVPDKLMAASEELFQIDDDISYPSHFKLPFETSDANTALTGDGLSMGKALGEATAAWLEERIAPTRTLVTNIAEFLVVHAQDMTAVDEFNGSEFDQYAHLVGRDRAMQDDRYGPSPGSV